MTPDPAKKALAKLSGDARKEMMDFLSVSSRSLGPAETMEALTASIMFKWRATTRRMS